MSEPKKRWMGWPVWVAIAIALPVLYVLSSGPMIYLRNHGFVRADILNTVYQPLIIAEMNSEPFRLLVERYISYFQPQAEVETEVIDL